MRQTIHSGPRIDVPASSEHDWARLSTEHGLRLDLYASTTGAGIPARKHSVDVPFRLSDVDVEVVKQRMSPETRHTLAQIIIDTAILEGDPAIDSRVPPELLRRVYEHNYVVIDRNSTSELSRLVVAYYKGEPVALAAAEFDGVREMFQDSKDSWLVNNVFVRGDLQGNGVGTKIMRAIMAELERLRKNGECHNPGSVHLICRPPLERFYAQFGFVKDPSGLTERERRIYTLTLTDGTKHLLTRIRMNKQV